MYRTFEPGAAFGITAAAIATMLAVAIAAHTLGTLPATALGLGGLGAVAVVACKLFGLPAAAIGLRGARPRYWIAAVLVGATCWYVNIRLVGLLPIPESKTQGLRALVDEAPLGWSLLCLAVLPAIAEELVFRGVLARALGRRSLIVAVFASAAVFAAYHLSLVQALPTYSLGACLALIAVRADSVAPTMLAHALNNAIAIVISRGTVPQVAHAIDAHPTTALALCAAATISGVVLAGVG
ncbi:MAG TPA: CPBP family intramembrane glutamic endopeptidase [Kofleriaceae bacterium]